MENKKVKKHLYIPISSRNLNNVLISEAIYPKAVFINKGFGVQRFFTIKPNPYEYSILAYSKLVQYDFEESSYEEFSVYLRFPTEIIKSKTFKKHEFSGIEIYQIYDSISLEDCDLGFLNKDNLLNARVIAMQALELKLLNAKLSKFIPMSKMLDQKYKSFWVDFKDIENFVINLSNDDRAYDSFDNHLDSVKVQERLKGGSSTYNIGLRLCDRQKVKNFLSIKNSCIIFNDEYLVLTTHERKLLQTTLVTIYTTYNYYDNDNFKTSKTNLLLNIINNVKTNIFKEDWETSVERQYLTNLLNNIANYTEFNLLSLSSLFWQSLALVFQGDREIDSLIDRLDKNSIKSKEIALCIWGFLFGYTNIPKTSYDKFFDQKRNKLTDSSSPIDDEDDFKISSKYNGVSINNDDFENRPNYKGTLFEESEYPNCPLCDAKMVIRNSKTGQFYGCSNYRKTGCKGTLPINRGAIQLKSLKVDYKKLILNRLDEVKVSKIKDLIDYYSSNNNGFKFSSVSQLEGFVNEYLDNEIEIIKIGRSKGFKLKT